MLEVINLHKDYEGKPLLRGISFKVDRDQTVCLLGSSGSGKSTILRIIAGLEKADAGQVLWNGKDLADTPVHQRRFGLMFQDYALFPHRNVEQNVAFGLRMLGVPSHEIKERVEAALERVNMQAFMQRSVLDLSGGEKQRVALARTLSPQPQLLMLDEPLGALDRSLREQLGKELRSLIKEAGIPALYVTHDQEEAFTIADHLILISEGLIEQQGSPYDMYNKPATQRAAKFLGLTNLLPGKIISPEPLRVSSEVGDLLCDKPQDKNLQIGQRVSLLLRPYGGRVVQTAATENHISGMVCDVVYVGEKYRILLEVRKDLVFQFYLNDPLEVNGRISLLFPPEEILCIPEKGQG